MKINLKKISIITLICLLLSTFLLPITKLELKAFDSEAALNDSTTYYSVSNAVEFEFVVESGTTLQTISVEPLNSVYGSETTTHRNGSYTFDGYSFTYAIDNVRFFTNTYGLRSAQYRYQFPTTLYFLKITIYNTFINYKAIRQMQSYKGLNIQWNTNNPYQITIQSEGSVYYATSGILQQISVNSVEFLTSFSVFDFLESYFSDYNELFYIESLSFSLDLGGGTDAPLVIRDYYSHLNQIPTLTAFNDYYGVDLNDYDFNLSKFLTASVGGFLNFKILPGLSVGSIFGLIVGLGLLIAVLKIFFGG